MQAPCNSAWSLRSHSFMSILSGRMERNREGNTHTHTCLFTPRIPSHRQSCLKLKPGAQSSIQVPHVGRSNLCCFPGLCASREPWGLEPGAPLQNGVPPSIKCPPLD